MKSKTVFVDIPNYEGLYQIDQNGNVKSLEKQHGFMIKKEKIISTYLDKDGYPKCKLCKDGKLIDKPIHRLVALSFIPNIENKPQVNHIDGNKTNNNVSNLEWCTNSENQIHSWKIGLNQVSDKQRANGKKQIEIIHRLGLHKVYGDKILQYDLDGNFIKEWNNNYEATQHGKFYSSGISNCCSSKYKQHKGYIWKYKKEVMPDVQI